MFTKLLINLFAWIEVQFEWLKSFFSESDGKGSNKRLLSTLVVVIFISAYSKVSIKNGTIADIPMFWACLIAAILGLNILDWLVKGYINKTVGKDEVQQ